MPLTAGGTAPYAPPGTVIEMLKRHRDRGIPGPWTPDVLERAGVSETLSQRTLQAFKLVELLDSEGNPTPEFEAVNRLPDAEYKERLGEMLCGVYGEVITFADPATDSIERVRDAFRPFNPRGQQDRMVTLFLGLLDYAGIDVSVAMAGKRANTVAAGAQRVQRMINGERNAKATPAKTKNTRTQTRPDEPTALAVGLPPGLVGLLHQIPRDGDAWTTSRRDAFMQAFTAVLDFTIPVDDQAPSRPAPEGSEV
jgi:hypothetical protein